jgi:drug/metabolite transporter (DMT)-like permease
LLTPDQRPLINQTPLSNVCFKSNAGLALSLLFAVFLWGASNAGTKHIVASWPPIWTGGSRFLSAGLLLLLLLRFTRLLGERSILNAATSRRLWSRGGLTLAAYIVAFNWALRFTSASHVALYLGCAPIWALLWEGPPARDWSSFRRYGAAALALGGLVVLFQPALKQGNRGEWIGEILGLGASLLWTVYGRECRRLAEQLSGVEITAHTMCRAGLLLLCLSTIELAKTRLTLRADLVWTQLYCIIGGGVITFWIWNNALRRWPTSQVLLFNNLIPLSTMSWSWACLGEPVTPTFWFAMLLVFAGVLLGQTKLKEAYVLRNKGV